MCGIAGFVNRRGEGADRELLARMTSTLAHRGPDGDGLFLEGPAGLGHRRLSIIDVDGGAAPMSNEDGSIWVTFNGEIYNDPELRAWLLSRGHVFRTGCDTESLVHLYEEAAERDVRARDLGHPSPALDSGSGQDGPEAALPRGNVARNVSVRVRAQGASDASRNAEAA